MIKIENIFYVYAYYLKSTNHIFHIGKGKNNRYLDTKNHRNKYFQNILNKYKDDVDVKILKNNLTEQEAWDLERQLIKEYKEKGQCETNLHEGGCGGNTGNYDNPERNKKLSEAAKLRVGEKNPMYGKHHTEESKQKIGIAQKGKTLSPEHKAALIKANIGRKKTLEEIAKIKERMTGRKLSKETYDKMMDKDCPFLYQVYLNDELLFENISSKKMEEFCHDNLGISRAITDKVIKKEWKPTFKKHQHLANLRIERINRKCIDQG